MDILYISAEYPPETGYGGIGTYTRYIAEGMSSRGHNVAVIARCENGKESSVQRNSVIIHRISPKPYPLPSYRYAYPFRRFFTRYFPHFLNRISWCLAVAEKINHLRENRPPFDIIEAPECGAEGFSIRKNMANRFIVRLHTPWEIIRKLDGLHEPWGDRLLLPLIEKRTARRADAVSAPSHAIVTLLKRRWCLDKVTVVPNPLPIVPAVPTQKESWIYAGRIERRKGVHHLIAAYAVVRKEQPVPMLKLIGKAYGKDRTGILYGEVIRTMINGNNLHNDIIWIEGTDMEGVARQFSSAAVAFFPSLWENFPYACLEAMAHGCTIVASDCGGFREIISPGENGILVQPDSTEAIESAMRHLLESPERSARLGSAAGKRVAELTGTDRICGEMERFYQRITEC